MFTFPEIPVGESVRIHYSRVAIPDCKKQIFAVTYIAGNHVLGEETVTLLRLRKIQKFISREVKRSCFLDVHLSPMEVVTAHGSSPIDFITEIVNIERIPDEGYAKLEKCNKEELERILDRNWQQDVTVYYDHTEHASWGYDDCTQMRFSELANKIKEWADIHFTEEDRDSHFFSAAGMKGYSEVHDARQEIFNTLRIFESRKCAVEVTYEDVSNPQGIRETAIRFNGHEILTVGRHWIKSWMPVIKFEATRRGTPEIRYADGRISSINYGNSSYYNRKRFEIHYAFSASKYHRRMMQTRLDYLLQRSLDIYVSVSPTTVTIRL